MEGPVGAFLLGDLHSRGEGFRFRPRGWGTRFDPASERAFFHGGGFPIAFGHFAGLDQAEQGALVGMSGDEGGAGVAAADGEVAETQVEAALEFLAFAVAIEAMGFENGADMFLEGEGGGGSGSGGIRGGSAGEGGESAAGEDERREGSGEHGVCGTIPAGSDPDQRWPGGGVDPIRRARTHERTGHEGRPRGGDRSRRLCRTFQTPLSPRVLRDLRDFVSPDPSRLYLRR